MARGFKTGGRTQGTPNKATVERCIRAERGVQQALDEGLMPLDVMLCRMRATTLPDGREVTDEQFEAACAAAPYLHAKLSATTLKGDADNPLHVHQHIDDNREPIETYLAEFSREPEPPRRAVVAPASRPLPRASEPPLPEPRPTRAAPRRAPRVVEPEPERPPPVSQVTDSPFLDPLAAFRGTGRSDSDFTEDR